MSSGWTPLKLARPERFELPTLWFEGVGGNSKSCLCRRVRAAALLHAFQLCSKKSKEFLGFHSRHFNRLLPSPYPSSPNAARAFVTTANRGLVCDRERPFAPFRRRPLKNQRLARVSWRPRTTRLLSKHAPGNHTHRDAVDTGRVRKAAE
jgi:hypothetical protein